MAASMTGSVPLDVPEPLDGCSEPLDPLVPSLPDEKPPPPLDPVEASEDGSGGGPPPTGCAAAPAHPTAETAKANAAVSDFGRMAGLLASSCTP